VLDPILARLRLNSSSGIWVPSRTSSPKSGLNWPFILMQCSHPERRACEFLRVVGVVLERALSAGFETGMGPGLDMGARRMAGKWEVGLCSMGDRDFTHVCPASTVCTVGNSEGFIGADLSL
jgi:hypothetical protein